MKKIMVFVLSLFLLSSNISYASNETAFNGDMNTVTIISETTNRKSLLGFKYKLINKFTSKEEIVDLTNSFKTNVELQDGAYSLVMIDGPEGYKKEESIDFNLPFKTDNGDFAREMKIYLKHIKKVRGFTQTGVTGQMGNLLLGLGFTMLLGSASFFVISRAMGKKGI